MKIDFFKYNATGNDFIFIDNRQLGFMPSAETARFLCHRQFGIGADGIILVGNVLGSPDVLMMTIINSDGTVASMCANGARAFAHFADYLGLTSQRQIKIKTPSNIYLAQIDAGSAVSLKMPIPEDKNIVDLDKFNQYKVKNFVDTGVPHLVFMTDEVSDLDIKKIAPTYRHDPMFAKGSNVNFFKILSSQDQSIFIRTFERGVEDETLSCGTGIVATALTAKKLWNWGGKISIKTRGGNVTVELMDDCVWYSGEVSQVYKGQIEISQ